MSLFLEMTTHIYVLFRCLAHVVNLANVAVMAHITKITAIEHANAIWEYDPELPGNCMLGGSLDIVAGICTLVVKVCNGNSTILLSYCNFLDSIIWTMY